MLSHCVRHNSLLQNVKVIRDNTVVINNIMQQIRSIVCMIITTNAVVAIYFLLLRRKLINYFGARHFMLPRPFGQDLTVKKIIVLSY